VFLAAEDGGVLTDSTAGPQASLMMTEMAEKRMLADLSVAVNTQQSLVTASATCLIGVFAAAADALMSAEV